MAFPAAVKERPEAWLVRRMPALEQASPPIKVTVHPPNTGDDWSGLPHDAAIRREDFTPPGYEARTLVREELTAFVRPDAAAQVRSPDDLMHCESITRPGDLKALETRFRRARFCKPVRVAGGNGKSVSQNCHINMEWSGSGGFPRA